MKKLITLTLITVAVTSSAHAQWIVYDPASNIQGILNTAQEIESAIAYYRCHPGHGCCQSSLITARVIPDVDKTLL